MLSSKKNNKDELEINHVLPQPRVYLDFWALRKIVADTGLRSQIIDLIASRNGTLTFSWLHFTELSELDDREQALSIADFWNDNLPHIGFIDVWAPFEDNYLTDGRVLLPDNQLMKQVVAIADENGYEGLDFRFIVKDVTKVKTELELELLNFVNAIEIGRQRVRAGEKLRKIPKPFSVKTLLDLTLMEFTHSAAKQNKSLSPNDVIDLVHSVLPLVTCDIVALDKHWASESLRVKKRLAENGITTAASVANSIPQLLDLMRSLQCQ